jgi:hypothetical protein
MCIELFRSYRLVNSKVVSFSGIMMAVVLFFATGHIENQQVFAFGGYGNHGGFGGHGYNPGYPISACGGGPYSITKPYVSLHRRNINYANLLT